MKSIPYQLQVGQLQNLLRLTFGLVPIVAGADKFLHLLAQWDQYAPSLIVEILPLSADTFMMIVGLIEITAGILVLLRPAIGAYVVAAWLLLIALSLIISGQHLDVAVRDIVMAIGAFVLAQLSIIPASQKNAQYELSTQ